MIKKALDFQLKLLLEAIHTSLDPFAEMDAESEESFRCLMHSLNVKGEKKVKLYKEIVERIYVSDLHRKAFKDAFIDEGNPNGLSLKTLVQFEGENSFLDNLKLKKFHEFESFCGFINVKFGNSTGEFEENRRPYPFYFYTRPFSLLELSILHSDWHQDFHRFKGFCDLFSTECIANPNTKEESNDSKDLLKTLTFEIMDSCPNRVLALTSFEVSDKSWIAIVRDDKIDPDTTREQRLLDIIRSIVSCNEKKINYVVLPELSVPRKMLRYISKILLNREISLITGVEYKKAAITGTTALSSMSAVSNQIYFMLFVNDGGKAKYISVIQEKVIPARSEALDLFAVGSKVLLAENDCKYLINHGGFWFAGLICNDLLDISTRARLRGKIDALMVIAWNKDVNTYDSVITSSANDLHAFVVLVNNRKYGDTRLRAPYKEPFKRDMVRLSGGELDFFVVTSINVEELREFQRYVISPDNPFKPKPTGYIMSPERRKVIKASRNK